MYNMYLNRWEGRFGNNLKQLSNAIYIAEKTNSLLKFKTHPLIKNQIFDFSKKGKPLREFVSTFWKDKIYDIIVSEKEVEYNRSDILKKYILPLLPYNKMDLKYDMVVHFRGGDIWIPGVHDNYVQCPLSYHEKIFEKENPRNILLVCEDKSNPAIEKLLTHPKWNCSYQSSTIENDINTLLNATILIKAGMTTFSDILALASPNLQKLYTPAFEYCENVADRPTEDYFITEATVIEAKIHGFIKVGDWSGSPAQKKQILEHSTEHIDLRII